MRRKATWATAALVMCLLPSIGQASPIGPVYPPPGSVTFSSNADPTHTLIGPNGLTRSYSGFNPIGNWSELYWNITDASVDGVTLDTITGAGLGSASLTGNEIDWVASTPFSFFDPACSCTLTNAVEFTTKFYQADGTTPLLSSDFSMGGPGMPLGVLDITPASLASWGGGFKVQQLWTIVGDGDVATYFNSHNGGGGLSSASNAAFWYDPPAASGVPEPGSLFLLGGGFLIAARKLRRSKS